MTLTPSDIGIVTICLSPVELADRILDLLQTHLEDAVIESGEVTAVVDWNTSRVANWLSEDAKDAIDDSIRVNDERRYEVAIPDKMTDLIIGLLEGVYSK